MVRRNFARSRDRRLVLRLAALGLGGLLISCGRGGEPPNTGDARGDNGTARGVEATAGAAGRRNKGTSVTVAPTQAPEQVCLVTKDHGVSAGYEPPDLTLLPARVRAGDGVRLRQVAADALVELIDSARTDGHEIFALSGFRSYEEQERVMFQEIALVGRQTAEKQVAPPGHSEHQLGLAVDITGRKAPYELRRQFGEEPEGKWLAANAPRFGFVISYPDGKEQITGYTYEPWHIRHVGTPLAEQVAASGLTLTEYLPKYGMAGGCP